MKISVIGCGYVGTVTGACLSEFGHSVIFSDVDSEKMKTINAGKAPVFEPGLDKLLQKNRKRIITTPSSFEAVQESMLTFICVGTPSQKNGSIDLKFVRSASKDIGKALRQKKEFYVVVVKSTVLPGTTEDLVKNILEQESGKKAFVDFGLASNPEFLKEGDAVADFFNPDRIVIGSADLQTQGILEEVYSPLSCPKVMTSIKTAEMIKYVSNAFLATKISFANEIGNLCKKLGIDTFEVFKGVGLDRRINPAFFRSGAGFGGSCFPKDVRALIAQAGELGSDTKILQAVMKVNEDQPLKMVELLKNRLQSLEGRRIGVLGFAFKPNTDDIRDSRAIPIVETLLKNGAQVVGFDPMASENFKKVFPEIDYAPSPDEVLDAEAVLIVTDWEDFKQLDYSNRVVIDGRNIGRVKKEPAVYDGVCW